MSEIEQICLQKYALLLIIHFFWHLSVALTHPKPESSSEERVMSSERLICYILIFSKSLFSFLFTVVTNKKNGLLDIKFSFPFACSFTMYCALRTYRDLNSLYQMSEVTVKDNRIEINDSLFYCILYLYPKNSVQLLQQAASSCTSLFKAEDKATQVAMTDLWGRTVAGSCVRQWRPGGRIVTSEKYW